MQLDYSDSRPIYEQIKEKTKEYVVSGLIGEHEKLPSVRELAAQLAINPNTIQKAYKELENEGYIYSQKSKGYFVAPMKKGLQQLKKEEALEKFVLEVKELKYLSTEKEELIELINKIYKEGN